MTPCRPLVASGATCPLILCLLQQQQEQLLLPWHVSCSLYHRCGCTTSPGCSSMSLLLQLLAEYTQLVGLMGRLPVCLPACLPACPPSHYAALPHISPHLRHVPRHTVHHYSTAPAADTQLANTELYPASLLPSGLTCSTSPDTPSTTIQRTADHSGRPAARKDCRLLPSRSAAAAVQQQEGETHQLWGLCSWLQERVQ
jgi:hypothetical protein